MTLAIDDRRRAMLAQMGVPVEWLREAAPEAAAIDTPQAVARGPLKNAPPPQREMERSSAAPVFVTRPSRDAIATLGWDALAETVASCRACKLCETRHNTVFGVGDTQPDWMIVGEAPGESEDAQGEPFVGQAGKLLDNMLKAVGLARGNKVYIANVLKCRPPNNRNPEPEEVAQCEPFLRRQVELLQPKIILAMGRFAVQTLLDSQEPIGRLRGRAHAYMGIPLVVTYHPAYLLRNLPDKAKAWADLCLARQLMAQKLSLRA